ncbi:MAG: hypothetical protein QXI12_10525 [Candidatus Methanomethyliaceae archaeon]
MLRKFVFGDSGQGTGEYAVMAGLVIVAAIAAFSVLAPIIREKLKSVGNSISGVNGAQ